MKKKIYKYNKNYDEYRVKDRREKKRKQQGEAEINRRRQESRIINLITMKCVSGPEEF